MKKCIKNIVEFLLMVFVLGINIFWIRAFNEIGELIIWMIGAITFFFGIMYFMKEIVFKEMWKSFKIIKKENKKCQKK